MKVLDMRTNAGLSLYGVGRRAPRNALIIRDGGFTDEGAAMRAQTIPRPQAHGDFDMPGFLSGRLMPLKGWAIADSEYELAHLRDQVFGHGAAGGKFRVTIDHGGRTMWADARVASGTAPTFSERGGVAEWSMTWWFPDPRRYGDATTYGPSPTVQVIQRGNFPALPTLHITGSAPGGYTITGPAGRQIIVTRALATGVPHRFDMATGRLYVGGGRVLGGVARADLFSIPPTLPPTSLSINAGLQLRVDVTDTFI